MGHEIHVVGRFMKSMSWWDEMGHEIHVVGRFMKSMSWWDEMGHEIHVVGWFMKSTSWCSGWIPVIYFLQHNSAVADPGFPVGVENRLQSRSLVDLHWQMPGACHPPRVQVLSF